MFAQLAIATLLIVIAGWVLPKPVMRLTRLPPGAAAILCTLLLAGVSTLLMFVMDASDIPLRFADPAQEGAFTFSTIALAIPGCIVLAARIAMLKDDGS